MTEESYISNNGISNNQNDEKNQLKLSSDFQNHILNNNKINLPPIQNLNNLILSCVKNEEYCYSFIDYLKKIYHIRQIDYYLAYLNIIYCFKPKELIEMSKMRKHLKNKYGRDDPGFLLLLIIYIYISSISYSITLGIYNPFKIFNIFFIQTFVFLITFGLIISMINKIIIDKYFNNSTTNQTIEYIYAFDIHCNGFVPMYTFCAIIPFIFIGITSKDNYMIQVLLSNSSLCIGILYYSYVTFISYFSLPFVRKNKFVTLGIWPIIFTFLIGTLCNFNFFKYFCSMFFTTENI